MRKYRGLIALLLIPLLAQAANPPIQWGPTNSVLIQAGLDFQGQVQIVKGSADPTAVAQCGAKGSLYLRFGAAGGSAYEKSDNGCTTGWVLLASNTGVQGATGQTGASGASGQTGASGASGQTGGSGATGATGQSGATGASGAVGQSGLTGSTGSTGFTGATGAGQTGQTGSSGATGATGQTGASGLTGATGQSGLTGATGQTGAGATGATGQTGLTGATGASGQTGASGLTGASGQTGASGNDGAIGSSGSTGASGKTGASGLTGASGQTGATGAGASGASGQTGQTGASGQSGASGLTGATGQTGLTGASGATGQSGATGATGQTGGSGTTGATGQTGASGLTGATGQSGVSGATGQTGSMTLAILAKTANYTVLSTDNVLTGSGSAFTFTLPAASSNSGKVYQFKKTDSSLANIITISRAGSDTIDGANTTTLNTQYETVTLVSDGSASWIILSREYPSVITGLTFTANNFGTGATSTTWYTARHGNILHVVASFQTPASLTAGICSLTTPTNITIDTTVPGTVAGGGTAVMGTFYGGAGVNQAITNASPDGVMFYDGSGASTVFFAYKSGDGFAKDNCSTIFNASHPVMIIMDIPVSGWN